MPPMPFSEWLFRYLAWHISPYLPPRKPGRFTLTITAQENSAVMTVTATLPEKTASDVEKFTLKYAIDGVDQSPIDSAGDPVTFSAAVGSTVVATFTETDGSGNESVPSEPETLVITDTIGPPQPGAFGLAVTGQDA